MLCWFLPYEYSHFLEEETEALSISVTFPRKRAWVNWKVAAETVLSGRRVLLLLSGQARKPWGVGSSWYHQGCRAL